MCIPNTCTRIRSLQAAGVSYRFNISVPAGCTPYTSTCTFFAALRTNDNSSSWLDYYMEGVATGYLALGWNNVSQTVSIHIPYTVAMARLFTMCKTYVYMYTCMYGIFVTLILCACFSVYSIMHMPYILTSPINETTSKKVLPYSRKCACVYSRRLKEASCVNRRVNTRILA